MPSPTTLRRDISPPPTRKPSTGQLLPLSIQKPESEKASSAHRAKAVIGHEPRLADIEAGVAKIQSHLEYFSKHLGSVSRSTPGPRLSIKDFQSLYRRNQHDHGHHFVVHQHDHPISGVHYDLRLQFSDTSTVSFAVPYGLPGNPNTTRPHRMAIETRVHNLWNNLIESASHATGSLLIWDTGEYEILPWKGRASRTTDDESSGDETQTKLDDISPSERLISAFQRRHIRLRLHGTRLPPQYTISLRLPSQNDRGGRPTEPTYKRRRLDPNRTRKPPTATATDSDTEAEISCTEQKGQDDMPDDDDAGVASNDEDEDASIRANNAYSGSTNTIGSIHQRNWLLTLDRKRSGFYKARIGSDQGRWVGSWDPFFVRGRDSERSVVTGRNADEVLEDEGVERFVGRKMWMPILE